MVFSLGSVVDRATNQLGPLPTGISGAEALSIANDTMLYMQEFTGLTIGSVNIDDRYSRAMVNLTIAAISKAIDGQGGNATSYQLDAFTISKSFGEASLSNSYQELGMEALKRLGRTTKYYQAYG